MIDHAITVLVSFVVEVISAGGYLGIAALMAIESAGIPLPSEIIMPFAGYLTSVGQFGLLAAATAGAIGCNVGSTVAYLVAAKGGRPAIERWGPYVLIRPVELGRAEKFFSRYGAVTVFVGRLLPVVRTFISFPAGLARMPMLRFQLYSFLGSWPWCLGLAYAGFLLGARWDSDPTFRMLFRRFDTLVAAVLVFGFAWFVWSRRREIHDPKKK